MESAIFRVARRLKFRHCRGRRGNGAAEYASPPSCRGDVLQRARHLLESSGQGEALSSSQSMGTRPRFWAYQSVSPGLVARRTIPQRRRTGSCARSRGSSGR
jgi:hypothetical protein